MEPPAANAAITMLPADQVAAIIEQMRIEQARLLKEQQEAIVQQVMQSLRESGITGPSLPDRQQNSHLNPKLSHQSTSELEKNLHSLVLHSLDESGLDYPHVQRCAYVRAADDGKGQQTRSIREKKRVVIVSRSEGGSSSDFGVTESGDEQQASDQVGDVMPQHAAKFSRQKQAQSADRKLRKSPLCTTPLIHGSRRRRSSSKTRSTHGQAAHDSDEDAARDEEFASVRRRVGHKTLAILDRSRALLDKMKQAPIGQRSRGISNGDNTFVHRMRQKLVDAESFESTDCGEQDEAAEEPASSPRSPPTPTIDLHETSHLMSVSTDRIYEDSLQPELTAESKEEPKRLPNVICDEIEILRPPEHSPENEHEWENELARQILTIYATSVKAKAAIRPASRIHNRDTAAKAAIQGKNQNPRLGMSYSLPAIGRAHSSKGSKQKAALSRSPPRAVVHYSWEPSQLLHDGKVVVNMPKVPRPIWFAGTGGVKAVWCAVAEGFQGLHPSPSKPKPAGRPGAMAVCEHQLCEEIRRLEAKQQYSQCITTLETLLISLVRARGVDALEMKLWKQLVVTCNAFASRCVDYKKFSVALQLIKLAEHLIHNSILVDDAMRFELLAYLYDTYAHYYHKRGKSHAGLQYMYKAQEIHTRQSSWAHLAKCRLHIANLLSSQSKHQEAMTHMASILEMIEENKLEDPSGDSVGVSDGAASAQKICLAAVCYNNLAIAQLHLRNFDAASVATANAKRLAKLCLSYSNRWLAQFDATGNCVDLAIATLMEDVNAASNAAYKS